MRTVASTLDDSLTSEHDSISQAVELLAAALADAQTDLAHFHFVQQEAGPAAMCCNMSYSLIS